MRYLFFTLLFLTSCVDRSGQLTIVRGRVMDELGNGAAFKKLSVSSFQDNDGLFESEDPFFGASTFTTDAEGNYEFSFFNTFSRGSYSFNASTDSLFKSCISNSLELGTVNKINCSVQRKAPRLRVNFENLNDTTRYLIQLEDIEGSCNSLFQFDTLQVETGITEKAFLYRTVPNQSMRITVKIDTFDFEDNFFTFAADTIINVETQQINIDFPLF